MATAVGKNEAARQLDGNDPLRLGCSELLLLRLPTHCLSCWGNVDQTNISRKLQAIIPCALFSYLLISIPQIICLKKFIKPSGSKSNCLLLFSFFFFTTFNPIFSFLIFFLSSYLVSLLSTPVPPSLSLSFHSFPCISFPPSFCSSSPPLLSLPTVSLSTGVCGRLCRVETKWSNADPIMAASVARLMYDVQAHVGNASQTSPSTCSVF